MHHHPPGPLILHQGTVADRYRDRYRRSRGGPGTGPVPVPVPGPVPVPAVPVPVQLYTSKYNLWPRTTALLTRTHALRLKRGAALRWRAQ